MNFEKMFNHLSVNKSAEQAPKNIEKGWRMRWNIKKFIMALVALFGVAGPSMAQQFESGINPEKAKQLADEAKKIISEIGTDYTNTRAFLEKRAELGTNIENTVKTFTIGVDSVMGESMKDVLGRNLEVKLISNGEGLVMIQEIISKQDESKTLTQPRGESNYELNAAVIVDGNGDGIINPNDTLSGDLVGIFPISDSNRTFNYQEIYDGEKANTEKRNRDNWSNKIGSKFRDDQVKNGYFRNILEKGGIKWWTGENINSEDNQKIQLDYSKFLKELTQKGK